jgi:chemotaxis protein CheD
MAELDVTLPEVFVQPGESHLATEPVIFRTILGSCVGITFLVPRLGIGVLCHPMLPSYPVKAPENARCTDGHRYVDFSVSNVARRLDALGAIRREVQVKIFGGADVLAVAHDALRPTVGKLNCEAAIRILQAEGFDVIASSLGGISGLNIMFHTGTGEVLLRRLG